MATAAIPAGENKEAILCVGINSRVIWGVIQALIDSRRNAREGEREKGREGERQKWWGEV